MIGRRDSSNHFCIEAKVFISLNPEKHEQNILRYVAI
jgi:hypothetical protein